MNTTQNNNIQKACIKNAKQNYKFTNINEKSPFLCVVYIWIIWTLFNEKLRFVIISINGSMERKKNECFLFGNVIVIYKERDRNTTQKIEKLKETERREQSTTSALQRAQINLSMSMRKDKCNWSFSNEEMLETKKKLLIITWNC